MAVRVETEKGGPGSRREVRGLNSAPRNSAPEGTGEKCELLSKPLYYGIMRTLNIEITANIEITQAPMAMKKSIHSLVP
jgi:hypothetical protein